MALPFRLRSAAVIVAVVAVVGLSACGDDDPSTVGPSTPTTGGAATTATTALSAATTTVAAGRVAEYHFAGGKVSGDSRVTVKLGDQITVRVTSDVAEEVHIHTYDRKVELEPNVPGEVTFTADIPGVHEVELEDAGLHLFSLEVQ
jgi:hypothetical protein